MLYNPKGIKNGDSILNMIFSYSLLISQVVPYNTIITRWRAHDHADITCRKCYTL